VNGTSYFLQDEFHVLIFISMVEAYQVILRIEEKLLRKIVDHEKRSKIWKRIRKKTSGRR
jgi:hypothetical protein